MWMGVGMGNTQDGQNVELIHGALERKLEQCCEKKQLRNTACPKEKVKEFQRAKVTI